VASSLHLLPRSELDTVAWDGCVTASPTRIVYGCTWYLDAILSEPGWKWMGLVMVSEAGTYQAVMPVPLRRKFGRWVVHQPLFCQFLGVFSTDSTIDPTPFYRAVLHHFRYGSKLSVRVSTRALSGFERIQPKKTYVLDLNRTYETIAGNYSRDRRLNLRQAQSVCWQVVESDDIAPLITLFQTHHAAAIQGGVGEWAYILLTRLYEAVRQRQLATLRYALLDGQIEAGTLFMQEGNRLIYLFNAASDKGRTGNARTLLIDQLIRKSAQQPLLLDFESPDKASIAAFYRSFGAIAEEYQIVSWNRLTRVERLLLSVKKWTRFRIKAGKADCAPSHAEKS
jgi:hypothetical protein